MSVEGYNGWNGNVIGFKEYDSIVGILGGEFVSG
jgi:hypothetical protein